MKYNAPRLLIETRDVETFEAVKRRVQASAPIFVESRRRLMLSTGPLPPDKRRELEAMGAVIRAEVVYDPD
ncbi:MAG: hypothetical protein K0R61_3675 [Microvirga sp.]|nr:hypothetical protein [Microvirga sp.]